MAHGRMVHCCGQPLAMTAVQWATHCCRDRGVLAWSFARPRITRSPRACGPGWLVAMPCCQLWEGDRERVSDMSTGRRIVQVCQAGALCSPRCHYKSRVAAHVIW